MLLIGGAALIFFGPDQLPKVAKRAGQVVRDVQNTSQSFIREMERAADDTERREREAASSHQSAAEAAFVKGDASGVPSDPPVRPEAKPDAAHAESYEI